MQKMLLSCYVTLDVNDMGDNVAVQTATLDSGIELIFARNGDIHDLSAKYRMTYWARPHVINPMKCGVLLPNQGATL